MALPRIETSTRRIEIMPERHFARGIWGEVGREIGSTARTAAGAMERISEVRMREEELRKREAERQAALAERNARALDADARRMAEYNERLAENFIANAAIGYDQVDPNSGERKFIPGKLQKTRAEMTAEGTDSVKITRSIIADMRRQKWYTSMEPAVRKHFDRQFLFTEDKWMRHAAENDLKVRQVERVETMKKLIGERARGVQSLYGFDDNTFMRGATTAAFKNFVDLQGSAIENSHIFEGMDITPQMAKEAFAKIKWRGEMSEKELEKKYNEFLSGVVEFSINRVTALQKAAAENQGLGSMDSEACLKKADEIIDGLRETYFLGVNPVTGKEIEVISEDQANAIIAETERARNHLGNIIATETRKAREEKLRETTKSELSIRDIPQELWADAYETLGRDKVLMEKAPEVAMRYLDTARQMREAYKEAEIKAAEKADKAKAKAAEDTIKATEDGLATSLSRLQLLKFDGSISPDEENEAQAEIWRRFRVEALRGGVSEIFMRSFQNRLQTGLSEDETDAMRKFYAAFGYSGELSPGGIIPSAEKKEKAREGFYAPKTDGEEDKPSHKKISGKQLFEYGEKLLRTLKTLPPGMNRSNVVEAEISRLKVAWIKENYSANLKESVQNILKIQRESATKSFLNQSK